MTKKKEIPVPSTAPEPKAELCENALLVFPSLGITLIQTFTLDSALQFKPGQNTQGFVRRFSYNELVREHLWHNENTQQASFVDNYELEGFNFNLTYHGYDDEPDYDIQGHCAVKMDVFFGKTVSVTYRFNISNDICKMHKPFTIDRLIYFLETYLYSEGRSFVVSENPDDLAMIEEFENNSIRGSASLSLPLAEDGSPLDTKEACKVEFNGKTSSEKAMMEILRRYKSFIIRNCTCIRPGTSHAVRKTVRDMAISSPHDDKYAFISVPHNFQHIDENKDDLFSTERDAPLKNGEVIEHIKRHHKKELMGLFSMIPEVWIDSNEDRFESVCGQDVTLNSDDCAFFGDMVGIYFYTYPRGKSIWGDFLLESEKDGIIWPECLLILQFYLAQRSVIRSATRILLQNAVSNTSRQNLSSIVSRNQDINFFLAQSMLQFEAVQYKSTTCAQVADGIANRLNIKAIKEQFEHHMSTIDKSLRNIKDSLSASREIRMSIILGIVSIISAFQLFFVGTSMPFLSDYWNIESGSIGAILITLVAGVAVIVILLFLASGIKTIFPKKH